MAGWQATSNTRQSWERQNASQRAEEERDHSSSSDSHALTSHTFFFSPVRAARCTCTQGKMKMQMSTVRYWSIGATVKTFPSTGAVYFKHGSSTLIFKPLLCHIQTFSCLFFWPQTWQPPTTGNWNDTVMLRWCCSLGCTNQDRDII